MSDNVVRSRPAIDPTWVGPISDFNPKIKKFHSIMFRIDPEDTNGDNRRYEAFMEKLLDPENLEILLVDPDNGIRRSFFKDTLIIHIEYAEYEMEEQKRNW